MKTKSLFVVFVMVSWILAACQPGVTTAPPTTTAPMATSVPPTNTPVPTNTPLPTETPKPTITPLPEGVLFRDDFEGEFQPGGTWENENPSKWSFTDDGWLQIIGEFDSLLGQKRQNNLLWHPLPEGNFVITVHMKSKPFENFQQSTIYIYENPDNFIALTVDIATFARPAATDFTWNIKSVETRTPTCRQPTPRMSTCNWS